AGYGDLRPTRTPSLGSARSIVRVSTPQGSPQVTALDEEIAETDRLIEGRFSEHRHAEAILSMPGIGTLLGAEFIALTGGDMDVFGSPDRLAGVAGLAPVPRDSGKVSGKMRRPHRYNRRLLRLFYLSAQVAARCCPVSKNFYDRKRSEGKNHKQAVLALAHRRLNVLWALIRDHRTFEVAPPPPSQRHHDATTNCHPPGLTT
ncbi:transposase, partial [Streptomyces sp. NPDC002730]|uniref:transposase n=1 Tax=Streptomyces sp. NPDC002730 TaxID=3364662 RepID=UPI0036B50FBF